MDNQHETITPNHYHMMWLGIKSQHPHHTIHSRAQLFKANDLIS